MRYEHLRPLGIKKLEECGLTDGSLLVELEKIIDRYIKSQQEQERNKRSLELAVKSGTMGSLG